MKLQLTLHALVIGIVLYLWYTNASFRHGQQEKWEYQQQMNEAQKEINEIMIKNMTHGLDK